jgi:hypothetical protein
MSTPHSHPFALASSRLHNIFPAIHMPQLPQPGNSSFLAQLDVFLPLL